MIFIIPTIIIIMSGVAMRHQVARRRWVAANLPHGETYVDRRGVLMERPPR